MNNPIISWYIQEDNGYIQDDEYYLGSFTSNSNIELNVQVWNNRYGSKNVDNIDNARLSIYFDNIEDSSLLQYCTVSINNESYVSPDIEVNRATLYIGNLSGSLNNGLESSQNNSNYKNINLKFSNLPSNLKNDLKNMFLDIEID